MREKETRELAVASAEEAAVVIAVQEANGWRFAEAIPTDGDLPGDVAKLMRPDTNGAPNR